MSVVVIEPPQEPIVSLDDAKLHLRVDHDDDDIYIEGLVAVAIGMIDGPGGWLGRALGQQTLEWRGDDFCDVDLIYTPVIDIESVSYTDANGADQTVPDTEYRLTGLPDEPALRPTSGKSWPSVSNERESVRIRYLAGWPFDGDSVWTGPAPIRHAVLMTVSEFYENREAAGDGSRVELPFAVTALLSIYRRFV